MLEETVSIWGSLNSWFTPTALFLLINLVIGTIVIITSKNGNNHHQEQHRSHLDGSPSLLHRIKSVNFYSYTPQEPDALLRSPSLLHRIKSINNYLTSPQPEDHNSDSINNHHDQEDQSQSQSIDEIYAHVSRSKSDTRPTAPVKKMKKSASAKSAFVRPEEAEEAVEARRPATVREARAPEEGEDEEVDAKADDFINKFKQQLKLQRLDSILRYKRGSAE